MLHENYQVRIRNHEEALEYFTKVFNILKIKRRLDEGTYNRVYEVIMNPSIDTKKTTTTTTKALRLSLKSRHVDVHLKEHRIHGLFSKEGVALNVYESGVLADASYDRNKHGWSATLTEVAIGSLDYCLYRFPERYNNVSDEFIHRICTIVIKTAHLGFMCGDIKPENILVLNDVTYMTDLDPTFCTKNEFLKRFCKIYKISSKKCRMGTQSYAAIRKLKSRLMLFQLWKFIAVRYPKCQEFNVRFLKMCVDYINDIFPEKTNTIVVNGVILRPLEVIENILGQEDQYYTKVVLNHYFGTVDMLKHKSFQNILGSMYATPPTKTSNTTSRRIELKMAAKGKVENAHVRVQKRLVPKKSITPPHPSQNVKDVKPMSTMNNAPQKKVVRRRRQRKIV